MFIETMKRFSVYESDPPGEGDPPEEGGGGGDKDPPDPPAVATIPLSALPEDLRDKSIPEIQFTLGRLISTINTQGETNKRLRQELEASKALPPEPPEPDPYEGKTTAEVFEDDPEAGVMRVLEKKGLLSSVSGTMDQVGGLIVDQVAGAIADFGEYREDVESILTESGITGAGITKEKVLGAYTMAVGSKALADKQKRSRELANPENPTSDPPEGETVLPELTGLEKEIFESSGMTRERYEVMKSEDVEVKTPTSPKGY